MRDATACPRSQPQADVSHATLPPIARPLEPNPPPSHFISPRPSPTGWDKTFALNHIKDEGFTAIHFFGDKTYKGGNDYEIYEDPRTIGHAVTCPEDTMAELRKMFNL